jgi:multidrug efflux pump subunit AcrA (membrane-fusion protein)
VTVRVAEADLKVAESEQRRLGACVGYLTLIAPCDGVITARNANTFDFVLPQAGDHSANERTPHPSPDGAAAPIYAVDRTDLVRNFVDVPEADANDIAAGTKATVLVKGDRDEPIPAVVTRTSWALNVRSRMLRVEIDLPNPGGRLLPGMYACVKMAIERPQVHALPVSALTFSGERVYCWTFRDGRSVRTELRTGVGDGQWIEVTNRQAKPVWRPTKPRRRSTVRSRCCWANSRGWPTVPRFGSRRGRTRSDWRAARGPTARAVRCPRACGEQEHRALRGREGNDSVAGFPSPVPVPWIILDRGHVMFHVISSVIPRPEATLRPPMSRLSLALLAVLWTSGCHHEEEARYTSVAEPPTVRLIQPQMRNIVRVVGQPSFIEAYERTSIYPKLAGYIEKWRVDIGDQVKKDQVLATLYIPELVEEHGTKGATVGLDRERVALAKEVVEVASADVKAAQARVEEAKAELDRYQAEVNRWDSEVRRLRREVERGVVDPQVLLESTDQLKSSTASKDAAKATIMRTESELLSREAALAKAKVDVRVAEADLKVAESEEKRVGALVGYMTLPAPFDGVIVARNANTFDFVLPATGDPSADPHVPHLSPGGGAAPVYVVDRTDIVRVFVDVPEQDANFIRIGSKASVLARAYRDQPIAGNVTRTSWALNSKSRTLRAEIDLKNPGGRLLPGMYADAKVIIERPDVWALPVAALVYVGETTFCWNYEDGRARRAEIRTGVSDGEWIEVTGLQVPAAASEADQWTPIDGKEQVILGDLSILSDGGPVTLAQESEPTKVASETPGPVDRPASSSPGVAAGPR